MPRNLEIHLEHTTCISQLTFKEEDATFRIRPGCHNKSEEDPGFAEQAIRGGGPTAPNAKKGEDENDTQDAVGVWEGRAFRIRRVNMECVSWRNG